MTGSRRNAAPLDLGAYRRIVVFSGAGLSKESGLPTYQGKGGTWTSYDPDRVASQTAFERDPGTVWDFHDQRRVLMGSVQPGEGHHLITELERAHPNVLVVTQNIDGLHQRAGSRSVVELHGSIWRVRCEREGRVWEDSTAPIADRRCDCGAWLRPDITWFGDPLDEAALGAAWGAARSCDLLLAVGTSGSVFPAAHIPVLAKGAGARLVEVNPEETGLSEACDDHVRATAADGLRYLLGSRCEPPQS